MNQDATFLPPDWQQRAQALDITQSFICEAPAGSGKTEILTQRLLALLAHVEQPEEVLAITFTRKAAAEMRKRVVDALQLAQNIDAPDEAHKRQTWELARKLKQRDIQKNWQLLHSPQRLRIQTFDSFCSSLTRQLPLHAILGSGLQVTEDSDELYARAVESFLHELENQGPFQQLISTLLIHIDIKLDKLANLLVDLLKKREAWLAVLGGTQLQDEHRSLLESHLQHIVDDKIQHIQNLFPSFLVADLISLSRYAAQNLREAKMKGPLSAFVDYPYSDRLPGSQPNEMVYWQGLRTLLLTAKGVFRKQVNRKSGFPSDKGLDKRRHKQANLKMHNLLSALAKIPGLWEALQELLHLPRLGYEDKQWQVLHALTTIMPRLVAHLHLIFKEHNTVDFNEISLRASQALGDDLQPSDLALRLDYQIRHILVDEFQDSSISQIHLLKQLTRGWQTGDGRTLFCVGDAMQSIYGFRGANVGLFLYCKKQGVGDLALKPLQLRANFRSQAGLVNWVNRVFQQAFPAEADIALGAVPYSQSAAVNEKLADRAVWLHGFGEGTTNWDEGRTVLGIVRKTRTDYPEASIAILVRNREHAAHILPQLKEAGLRYRAVDLQALKEKIIVQDLLSLTRALLHPGDKLAWFSVLRAPWCGLSLVDLEAISTSQSQNFTLSTRQQLEHCLAFSNERTANINDLFYQQITNEYGEVQRSLSDDGRARSERVLRVLESYIENRQRLPLRTWIEGCWLELGGPACLQTEEDRENAEAFFNLLEEEDQHGTLESFEHFEKRLDKLFAQPDPNGDELLQVMTIHKSKGLEFDVVILPSLHRSQRPNQPELFLWQTHLRARGEEELVFAPITESGKDTDPIYKHLQQQNRKKDHFENCRLLYVACTRAKKHLHLCATVKHDKMGELRPPPQNAMLHFIWPSIRERIKVKTVEDSEQHNVVKKSKLFRRLPADWHLPDMPDKHSLAPYVADYDFDNSTSPLTNNPADTGNPVFISPLARHCGSLLHQLLQEIAESGLVSWQNSFKKAENEYWKNWQARLLSLGLPPALLGEAHTRIRNGVEKILQDKNIHWMLSHDHPEKYSEFALCLQSSSGRLNNYVIDLLIKDKEGNTWIIDYKTSEPLAGQTLEDFIDNEKENYRFIMSQYQRAVQALGYNNIRVSLYFPLIQEWGYF